jgi:hypothetical protein
MLRSERAARSLLVLLVLSVLLAGCGGGDGSGVGNSQGQQGDRAAEGDGGAQGSEKKIAFGTIRAVKPDKGRISLKPTSEAQGDEPLAFKVADNTAITLDGREAEIGDVAGGQQAQIEYAGGGGGVNRATSVELFQVQRQEEN